MLEAILIMVGYCLCVVAGAVTNYIGTGRKIMCLLVIGIGGFVFCWFSPYPLNWVGWGSYMTGFILVFLMGKQAAKERIQKEIFDALEDNEYQHITKDANGNVKVRNFTVYNGGQSH